MNHLHRFIVWAAAAPLLMLIGHGAAAQAAPAERKPFQASFKPVVIDSADRVGTTLGLEYDLEYSRSLGGRGRTSQGSDVVAPGEPDVVIKEGELAARLRGTITASKEKNPHKLIDLAGSWHYVISTLPAWYRVGANLTFETDQSFANKQLAYGLSTAVSKVSIVKPGDAGSLLLHFARVNPSDDAARKAAEGSLKAFQRWNLEASYSLNLNHQKLRSIDFNYRYYQELSPSAAIRVAGLDRRWLGLVRANLDNDFFLQYSRGSLPFDQRSVRAVTMGWSIKFD
jgi:hypothetical protein